MPVTFVTSHESYGLPRVPRNPGRSMLPSSAWIHLRDALRLSTRETQIVQGVFDDKGEEGIAHELGISPHTVNTYFQRLYAKLHVCSRPQLIMRVMVEYLTLLSSHPDVYVRSCAAD